MPEVLIRSRTIQDPEDKRKTKVVEDYRVEVVDKPEETRVIFLISGPAAFEGGPSRTLSMQEEEIAALQEKQRFEQETGREIYQFHRDPLAGGLRPARPVTEQLYRAGEHRKDVYAMPPSGQFKYIEGETQGALPPPGHGIFQGRVGEPDIGADGKPIIYPSNIKPGNATMISRAGWTGEYL